MMKFRFLGQDEIETRVNRVTNAGVELLLFKDARVDANVLDETVGPENWQCEFYECKGTLFCKVGILIDRKDGLAEWVWKDDAGSPSNMEAAKGEASDAFKRACFKWGIGRELYSAPRVFVYADKCAKMQQGRNGKLQCYDEFRVDGIETIDRRITYLRIVNDSMRGQVVFEWGQRQVPTNPVNAMTGEQRAQIDGMLASLAKARGVDAATVLESLIASNAVKNVGGEIVTSRQAIAAIGQLKTWMDAA